MNTNAIKKLKHKKSTEISIDEIISGIRKGDKTTLSRAITIIESSLPNHQQKAQKIIEKCLPFSGKSIRIGITGIPGVGKSTFIEALGKELVKQGKKVAVLAIDPSSRRSKGSILGDKTRMSALSSTHNAFIRPSPASGTLGGVARKTRETILLCEAAGFDIIFVETVGVGQSETTVHSMVDFFLMLMLAGAGDELQGIKRGIMELADMILINKADENTKEKVQNAKQTYQNTLHLFPAKPSGWQAHTGFCSSVSGEGIDKVWQKILEFKDLTQNNGSFQTNRKGQLKFWLYETINSQLKNYFYNDENIKQNIKQFEKDVLENKISPFVAAQELLAIRNKTNK